MVAFKEIEIGVLPENWQVVKLVDAVSYIDYGFSQAIPKTPVKDGVKIVSTADISKDGKLLYYKIRNIAAPTKTISRLTLQDGDVLFNWRNTAELIGKSAVFQTQPNPHIFASFILRIRCDEVQSHNYFFCHLMNYFRQKGVFVKLARRAVNQANYNKNEISILPIPLPSLLEQVNIVKVLSAIQSAIENQEKIIRTVTELKRALMQKLFTEGINGEKGKLTEVGLVPQSWQLTEIGNLGEIITGTTPPTKNKGYYDGGGFPFISPGDLGSTKYVYRTEKELSLEGLKVSRVLPKDAIMIVCIGSTIGKAGLTFGSKNTTNQQINTIICSKELNPQFVYYLLNFKSDYIKSLSTPSPVPILSKGKFQKGIIPITKDKSEQDDIVEILSRLDNKLEHSEKLKSSFQELFKSMRNNLMTGQKRVKDLSL